MILGKVFQDNKRVISVSRSWNRRYYFLFSCKIGVNHPFLKDFFQCEIVTFFTLNISTSSKIVSTFNSRKVCKTLSISPCTLSLSQTESLIRLLRTNSLNLVLKTRTRIPLISKGFFTFFRIIPLSSQVCFIYTDIVSYHWYPFIRPWMFNYSYPYLCHEFFTSYVSVTYVWFLLFFSVLYSLL